MKENIDKSKTEDPPQLPADNPLGGPIAGIPAGTIDLSSTSQNMEVHHHPQVEKKNLKEYFFEFLMIFLAVTMGFVAENIRENIKEHESAKVYAVSMVNDLKQDTAELKSYLSYMTYASGNVDTFLQLVSSDDIKNITSGKLYWYGLFGAAENNFTVNDATFQQMKSSGSLRYFTNSALAQAVAKYDRLCRQMQGHQESDHALYLEVRKCRAQIFELKYNQQANDIYQSNKLLFSQQKIDSFIQMNPPLLSYDKVIFNQYSEMVRSRFHKNFVREGNNLLSSADSLITYLQKEYRLGSQ